ncbi:uncharacterized protein LOC114127744 [Aphis gossypii]|uniref:Reverse transcriptase domain-containing protein n=1 Tax=Aphis gossypii TaxID=80765 RepID=A0A9P0NHE2_APHGO|nr:uncharacterized protein LOC114127744 [Aphis gossypii]CAH1720584.1 unnamed protein product [Aphis gossypii]
MFEVEQRIHSLGLEIATNKTKAVMFTHKYKFELPELMMCGHKIPLSFEMTYQGVTIDNTLLFKSHVSKSAAKAEKIGSQLARLMPNVGGPREDRRRHLSIVVHSELLYDAPAWAHTMDLVPANAKDINKAQNLCLSHSFRSGSKCKSRNSPGGHAGQRAGGGIP